jgi:hypothetical protein
MGQILGDFFLNLSGHTADDKNLQTADRLHGTGDLFVFLVNFVTVVVVLFGRQFLCQKC